MKQSGLALSERLEQLRTERAPHLSATAYFQLITAEQVLKKFELEPDDLESGIINGSGDGVDSVYLFVNRQLVQEPEDILENTAPEPDVELFIFEASVTPSFELHKVRNFSPIVTDLCSFDEVKRLVGAPQVPAGSARMETNS